jgi:O-antigen/teichoic acid export membrane protein
VRDLVFATLKAGTGQTTAFFCAIASAKLLAVLVGPAGVGLFSLVRQIQQTLCVLASLGGQNAIVQGVASRQGADRAQFVSSVSRLVIAGAVIVGLATLISSPSIAALVFGTDSDRATLVRWIAVPVVLGALLIYFRGILNAHMRIGAVAWVNIHTALGALAMVVPAAAAYRAGHEDALVLILTGSLGLGLIAAVYQVNKHHDLRLHAATATRFLSAPSKDFLQVALPSLAALFIGMAGVLAVRAAITRLHGLPLAGHFDAAWSISVVFLVVFLTSIQTYLLPKLSASQTPAEWEDVIDRALRLSAIVAVPTLSSLIILKPAAVRLLYSDEFIDAVGLLRWTLLGDYVRVAGWVLATTLIARADMRAYLSCEVIWNVLFAAVALWLVPGGISGAGPAYLVAYAVYLVVLIWRVSTSQSIRIRARAISQWIAGLAIVLAASMLTWNDTAIVWIKLCVLPLAALYSWTIMSATERQFALDWSARWVARTRKA